MVVVPVLSIADALVGEGDGFVDVVVRLNEAATDEVRIDWRTVDGTARATGDFVAGSGTLSFEPGQLTQSLRLPILDDGAVEPIEYFELVLSSPVGAAISDGRAVVNILDNDTVVQPTVALGDAYVDEKAGVAFVTVSLDSPSVGPVSVGYATITGTAGVRDFVMSGDQVLTFEPGQTVRTIAIPIRDDDLVEPAEFFDVKLSNAVGVRLPEALARVFIGPSDHPVQLSPTISIGSVEVDEGAGHVDLLLRLSSPSSQPVQVDYATVGVTTEYGENFGGGSGRLVFAPGETWASLRLPVVDASWDYYKAKSFAVELSDPIHAILGNSTALVTIRDDDFSGQVGQPWVRMFTSYVDESAGIATMTVQLDRPGLAETNLGGWGPGAMSGGSASSHRGGQDYVPVLPVHEAPFPAHYVVFAPGELTQSFSFPLVDDLTSEDPETLRARSGLIVIWASDKPVQDEPVITAWGPVVGAADAYAEFLVTLSAPSDRLVQVQYSTSDATARAWDDYGPAVGSLAFAPGEMLKTVRVALIGNPMAEPLEHFRLDLSAPSNARLAQEFALATVVDDDAPRGHPLIRVGQAFVDEQAGLLQLPVTLDRPSDGFITVSVRSLFYADTFLDYAHQTPLKSFVSFVPGETAKTLPIPIIDDQLPEGIEHFQLKLVANGGTLVQDVVRAFIAPSDQPPQAMPYVEAADAVAGEGAGVIDFLVSLSGPAVAPVSVEYGVLAALAAPVANYANLSGTDYADVSGTLTFAPGEMWKTVSVPLRDDDHPEPVETMTLLLSSPSGVALGGRHAALGTIVDDDSAAGEPVLQASDVFVDESSGLAFVTLRLDRPAAGIVSVRYGEVAGSASPGDDFGVQPANRVAFAPGEIVKTIPVQILDDGTAEGIEHFDVVFVDVVGAKMPDARARVFIGGGDSAADGLPRIGAAMAFAAESDGAMRFVLTLDGPSSRPVHVDYTAADGTATGVADYVATAGSVTFRPGQTLATVVVPLRGDASAEQVETLELRLSNPDGGVLGTDRVAGIIVDDDHPSGAPTIQARGAVVDERDGLAVVSLSLDRPASGVVTLAVATVDGTATAGQDYVNQGVQTVVFGPGEVSRTVAVPLPDGAVAERPEFFDIVLSAPVGGTLQDERVHVVVGASDAAKVAAPVAHVGDAVAHEGDGFAEFVVSLDAPSDRVSSVMWATRAGSAGAGSDFVSASGLLTFAPGETLKALQVALRDDTLAETSETFFLDLTPVAGIAIGRATAVGTILDDDSPAAARAGAEANGGDGPDVLAGGRADDLLRAGGGADVISGGPGDDWLFGDAGDDLLLGDDGDDSLIGGAGADVLVGGPGDDTMEGGAGNDVYRVDSPRDRTVEADGEGIDSVRSPISWTLGAQIENLTLVGRADRAGTGNALDNSITGNDGDNLLRGKQGADTLSGESGADTLDGGPGADTLTGGPDADVFRFASELLPSDVDKVLDFESGVDRFELASDVFAGVGTAGGPMGAALFVIGTEATSPAHRVIYDPVSGMLWYDADGNGDAPAVPFAEVTPGTTVAAGDIWIG